MPQSTITTTASRVVLPNPYRRSLIFHNSSSNVLFLDSGEPGGLTTSNAGIRIPGGGNRTLNYLEDGEFEIVQAWSAVADTGSNTLVWKEFSGRGIATSNLLGALQAHLEFIAQKVA